MRGQALIEALISLPLVIGGLVLLTSVSMISILQLCLAREAYETLICCEWSSPQICRTKLIKKMNQGFKGTFKSLKITESSQRREIHISYKWAHLPVIQIKDSIRLPLKVDSHE